MSSNNETEAKVVEVDANDLRADIAEIKNELQTFFDFSKAESNKRNLEIILKYKETYDMEKAKIAADKQILKNEISMISTYTNRLTKLEEDNLCTENEIAASIDYIDKNIVF